MSSTQTLFIFYLRSIIFSLYFCSSFIVFLSAGRYLTATPSAGLRLMHTSTLNLFSEAVTIYRLALFKGYGPNLALICGLTHLLYATASVRFP
jgi:hypothetical protein